MENTTVPQNRRALTHFTPVFKVQAPLSFQAEPNPTINPESLIYLLLSKTPQLLKNCTFACLHLKFGGIGISVIFSLSVWTWTAFPN